MPISIPAVDKARQMSELAEFFGEPPLVFARKEEATVGFKRLTDTAMLPTKAHPTDSGFDLYADEAVTIAPGETAVVSTGVSVVLPPGHEATVRPRSGITSRTKLRVQLGTIDNAYRGNIGIIVDNIGQERISIHPLDKIAQLVVGPVSMLAGVEVFEVDETDRGGSGFGSTGV